MANLLNEYDSIIDKNAVPMMKCGHAANAKNMQTGAPVCAICIGITKDAEIIAEYPNLSSRKARCAYYGHKCHSEQPSSTKLPFFEHKPDQPYDEYYCGCYGWD